MATDRVNGSGNGERSGAHALLLLGTPLNFHVLQALEDGPKQQVDLRRATGSPAQTTLRAHLKELAEAGTIVKKRANRFPGTLEFELTAAGRDLLAVAATLERWLGSAPEGPLSLGTETGKAAVKALCNGWSTTMLRALATRPLSLTELDRIISAFNYPSLERRLAAMRLVGQVQARRGNGTGTPYAVTDWTRRAVGPLLAAIRWECRRVPERTPPPTRIDAEAAFLLAVPLLRLPADLSGSCRLAVELSNGRKHKLAGVLVTVEDGRITGCATRLDGCPDAWTSGSFATWLTALLKADTKSLETGGDGALVRSLLDGLHLALFDLPATDRVLSF